MKSSPLVMFMEILNPHTEVIKDYTTIRKWGAEEGKTKKEFEGISEAPTHIWNTYRRLHHGIGLVKNTLRGYGLIKDEDMSEFNKYLLGVFNKIDEQYPLKD